MAERGLEKAKSARKLKPSECWQAVVAQDSSYDGEFVFAVGTSGAYCRPSCSGHSHLPDRKDVRFFTVPEAAEAAGFRPCEDCHPQKTQPRDPQVVAIRNACAYIQENLDASPTLDMIGAHVGLSPFHLQRVFKRVMGISPRQYADACRIKRLKERLREGDSVTCALYDAGYSSSSRLYERSSDHLGMTPATYRRGGEGMEINYVVVESPLGALLVGTTDRGVCAVHLGDHEQELVETLHREYPLAIIRRNQNSLCDWVSAILDHLQGWTPHLELPLDIQATAFQWRVWQEICAIPYGETRTYGEIASALGLPGGASAVARAVNENPVSVLIPCHRTERADGEPTIRYTGRSRKVRRKLVANEQQRQFQPDRLEAVGD